MKVRAGGAAAAADPADLVALVHDATGAELGRVAVEMGVGGLDRAAVVDAYIAPVGAEPSGGDHHAIACGTNRGAARRRPVDTLVPLAPLREGVVPAAVARGEAPAIDRLEEQSSRPSVGRAHESAMTLGQNPASLWLGQRWSCSLRRNRAGRRTAPAGHDPCALPDMRVQLREVCLSMRLRRWCMLPSEGRFPLISLASLAGFEPTPPERRRH